MRIFQPTISGSLVITGSHTVSGSLFVNGPTESGGSGHLVTYNTASGLFSFTASAAVGGGNSTFNSTSSVIGDGASTTFTITHNFGTRNLHVTVYESGSNFETVYPDVQRPNTNSVRIVFANAPAAANPYIVYISQ